ncbi:IclR family transcriptional regulator C-terminal domain-containing protein [Streptomyces acidicola]|uniref:IclR family transcriptional regulator domain-containing protein n=1 Tax=Streptomyces acidicola TaxID=2596892 RepID=UPI0037B1498F
MLPNAPSTTPVPDTGAGAPPEAVAPLMRGITVLLRLTEAGGVSSLSGLEKATGLARSTVDRITATLARRGYVRLDGRDAVLAPRLMELGNAYLAALRLPGLLDAHADALADELDESVSLAVGDRDGTRFIHQATRRRAMSLSFRIGDLLPAERTAPGSLFATEWGEPEWARWRARREADPEGRCFPSVPPRSGAYDAFEERVASARAQGWALDDQLIEPGLVAVSVPVRDAGVGGGGGDGGEGSNGDGVSGRSRIACVASVVSHTSRHTADSLREVLLPRLRATVDVMEQVLRETPPPTDERVTPSGLAAWTGASKQELGREFVESLARGLTVITSFGEGRAELTLSDVAQATGLARATARRALITLEHLGYVESYGRAFRLTPRVLGLGFPPLSMLPLSEIAAPHLTALSARLHDSSSLAVLVGDEVQFIARAATARILSANVTVGTRLPAYATSPGRVMLADLPSPPTGDRTAVLDRVRRDGYALVDSELEEGLRSMAVPVREHGGRVVAAVNVAMHSSRRTAEECVHEVLPELREAVTRIEADLHVAGRFRKVPAG